MSTIYNKSDLIIFFDFLWKKRNSTVHLILSKIIKVIKNLHNLRTEICIEMIYILVLFKAHPDVCSVNAKI